MGIAIRADLVAGRNPLLYGLTLDLKRISNGQLLYFSSLLSRFYIAFTRMQNPIFKDGSTKPNAIAVLMWGDKSGSNAYEVTVERLSAAIKMGLYRPGEQLPAERELAELMGVSRTTLREAIRVLTEQRFLWVKRGRNGGTFVAEGSLKPSVIDLQQRLLQAGTTLDDILDYRLVVEPGVAALAAERVTPNQLEELQAVVEQMPHVIHHFGEHRRLDTQFHLLIAQATQCDRLVSAIASIHADLSDVLAIIPHSPTACLASAMQHQQILTAMQSGDANQIRQLMADHVTRTNRLLKGLLA